MVCIPCYVFGCVLGDLHIEELRKYLRKLLECTVYKTRTKRLNENKLEEFIWFRGEEI